MAISDELKQELKQFLSTGSWQAAVTSLEDPVADKLTVNKDGVWTATKDSSTNDGGEHVGFYKQCRDAETYAAYLKKLLETHFAVTVTIVEFKAKAQKSKTTEGLEIDLWIAQFTIEENTDIQAIRNLLLQPKQFGFGEQVCTTAIAREAWANGHDGIWKVVRTTEDRADLTPFFDFADNPNDYAQLIKQEIEQGFPVTVTILEAESHTDEFYYVVRFKVSFAPADDMTDLQLFMQIAAKLNGDVETGKFGGTIRVDATPETIEATATSYYRAVRQFCVSCSCNYRPLRSGGYAISLKVGSRIQLAVAVAA